MVDPGSSPKTWRRSAFACLPLAVRVVLGLLFLYTGISKAVDLTGTVLAVHGYDVAPPVLIHPIALGLALLEIVLGLLLLLGLVTRFAAAAAAVLAVVFLAVMVQAKARGLDISCGCFGGSGTGEEVTWFDILRDVPLLAAAVYVVWRAPGPLALDRLVRGRGAERELKIAIPLVLVGCVVVAAFVVPALTGALDLPQAAAPGQVSVAGSARVEPLPVGGAVPDFAAPALFGGTVSWSDYRGGAVVLVLWAPWCPDCRQQLPRVAQVVAGFPRVRLVSIVTAAGELPGPTPEKFMQAHGLTFPVALDSTDERLGEAFGVQGYPTIYYVKPGGTVAQVTVGATAEGAVRAAIEAIAG